MKSILIWTSVFTLILSSLSWAAAPQTINFQGYLTDNTGVPVSSPAKTMGFALYSTSNGKTPIWNEGQDVKVDKGIYGVALGSVTPINLPFDTQYYLGVTIPPDPEMIPRQALSNAPYAKIAETVSLACSDGGVLIYKSGKWQCGTVTTLPNAAATCIGTDCTISMCSPGWGDCNKQVPDGCEMYLKTSIANCGACGNICSVPLHMNSICDAGTCGIGGCNAGWGDCNKDLADGCEASLATDLNNCGGCGNHCAIVNATSSCVSSLCVIASCNTGFANCDNNTANGCETNIASNPNACGGCGLVCPSGNCTNGVCIPKIQGAACSANNQCASGICTDGVCCQSLCGGTCEKCNLAGQAGICSPIPAGQDPDNECGGKLCSGARTCNP